MAVVKGRGVKVEIASAFGTAKSVSAVTQASPGVATSTAHGLTDGTAGYFSGVSGMVQLEGQAARVDNPVTNAFDLQGLNTTNFSTFSGTCNFNPASAWVTLAEATSYSIGGGDAEKLNVTTLIDTIRKEENGLLAAQTLSLNVIAQTVPSAAMALVEAAAQAGTKQLYRITLPDGSLRLCYGEPSLPGEDVQQGGVGTGSMSITVSGFILKLAA